MVRYPLGGMLSWTLQYLVGLHRLGHDVVLVERADHAYACYDPRLGTTGADCSHGVKVVADLLERFGLGGRWCFVDHAGRHYGGSEQKVAELFATADVFMAMTLEECWVDRAAEVPCRVLVDGDPAFRQVAMAQAAQSGAELPHYDFYFTTGRNIGSPASEVPTAGLRWRPMFHPVDCSLFRPTRPAEGMMTTVMNWRSYDEVRFGGVSYGQKDVAFERFLDLPRRVSGGLEVAVAGTGIPLERLRDHGWRVRGAGEVTASFDAFCDYIHGSLGEFSVCKDGYTVSRSGWFSDRSAAYLASGRPVVLEDTGFSGHLPCGEGLFAVAGVDEAAEAIERVRKDPERHARAARALAVEHLDAERVLGRMLHEMGV